MGRRHRRREGGREAIATPAPFAPGRRAGWHSALLLTWIAIIYAPSLWNGFTFDDPSVVADASPLLSDPSLIGRLFSADYFRLSNESTYRPIVTLTYFLDWQLGHGQAWVFHLQSVMWHLVAVGGLLVLLERLGTAPRVRYSAAALYGVHPAITEAIDAVAFREDVLVSALGIWGLVALTSARPASRWLRIALGVLALSAAMLSKESGVVFLLLLPLTDWAVARARALTWRPSDRWAEYASVAACVGAYGLLRFVLLPASDAYGNRLGDSLAASMATGLVVVGYYLRLLVYPIALCADYRGVVSVVTSLADWRLWTSAAALAALTWAAWRARRTQPTVVWGWAWFVLALGPVSNVVPIPTFMAERFLHLPFIGLVVFTVAWLAGNPRRPAALSGWRLGVVLAAVLLLSATTWQRHDAWRSNEVLWQTTLRDHPTSQGAIHGYGYAMIEQGRYADGIAYLQRLLTDPTLPSDRRAAVALDVGVAYNALGQFDAARQSFERSIAAAPDARSHLALAMADYNLNRLDEARVQLAEALRLLPDYAEAYSALGAVLLRQGRRGEAIEAWQQAVRLRPGDASAHANIGVALGRDGRLDEGIAALERAVALEPQQAPWEVELARLLAARGRPELALAHIDAALRINPSFGPALEARQALTAK